MKYRIKPAVVDAIQLSDGSANMYQEWDDVTEFLAVPNLSGRAEHATVRRPRITDGGNVRVSLHTHEAHEDAGATDWIVRTSQGKFRVFSNAEFRDLFERVPCPADTDGDGDCAWCSKPGRDHGTVDA